MELLLHCWLLLRADDAELYAVSDRSMELGWSDELQCWLLALVI